MRKTALLAFLALVSCQSATQVPALNDDFVGEKYGCADFRIYRANKDGNGVLEIVSEGKHQNDTSYILDIAANSTVKVRIFRFTRAIDLKQAFCNDVGPGIEAADTLNAVAGKLRIGLANFKKGTIFDNFTVSVQGSDILINGKGSEKRIDSFLIDSVDVGWLPG